MSPKTKKILKIAGIVLVVIFIGLLVYYFFFKKPAAVQPPTDTTTPPIAEEGAPAKTSRLIAITDEAVLGAGLAGENKINYVAWDGSINNINFDGGESGMLGVIGSERIGEIIFASDGLGVGIRQSSPSGSDKFLVFDVEKKSLKALPQNTTSLSFSPDGEQIAFAVLENNANKIYTAGTDGTSQKSVTTSKIPDLALDWYADDSLAFKTKPSGLAYGLIYNFDLKSKKLARVLGNIYGLTGQYSPSGKKLLYSQTNSLGKEPVLQSLNLDKNTESRINILSLPEKCAWAKDNRTLLCGSINTTSNPIMPDDYYKGKIADSNEDIVRINLDLGQTQKIISGPFDAYKPFLSPDESYLFFINKIDGRLYRLTL